MRRDSLTDPPLGVDYSRAVVVGSPGAGKTTFARRLASIGGANVIEIDAVHWGRGWQERPLERVRDEVSKAVGAERWVFDGNYAAVRDLVWPKATAIYWLDFPLVTSYSRLLWRTLNGLVRRREMYARNRESLRTTFFSRGSILWWSLSYHGRLRRKYARLLNSRDLGAQVVVFKGPHASETYMRELEVKAQER